MAFFPAGLEENIYCVTTFFVQPIIKFKKYMRIFRFYSIYAYEHTTGAYIQYMAGAGNLL
jgi:hypothetical protein